MVRQAPSRVIETSEAKANRLYPYAYTMPVNGEQTLGQWLQACQDSLAQSPHASEEMQQHFDRLRLTLNYDLQRLASQTSYRSAPNYALPLSKNLHAPRKDIHDLHGIAQTYLSLALWHAMVAPHMKNPPSALCSDVGGFVVNVQKTMIEAGDGKAATPTHR